MRRGNDGWFSADVAGARAGARYKFRIDDEIDVPDPASAFQPEDVSGPSEVIDHDAYGWRADDWRGRPWQETVLIETHVGTFTPEGTYRAMIDKLDHLVRDRDYRARTDAAGGFRRLPATGAMTACCGTRPTAPMAVPTI